MSRWPGSALLVVALIGCGAGLGAGLLSGPLWLDETLSVEIARLPLPEFYTALRQDGAPPVYYLLLKAWIALFGTDTVIVRLPSVLLTVLALLLAHRLGSRLAGRAGGRAAVIVLAALPWTMRFGSETRMYLLVVVFVLAGALALLAVHRSPSRGATLALTATVTALLLTHYWSLFLLAAVGLWHLPAALRRSRPAARVVALRVMAALVLGGVLFLPWLPTFLYQAAHTGAPWATPPGVLDLVRTPLLWGGGRGDLWGGALAALLVPLVALAAWRRPDARALAGVAVATLLLAWAQTAVLGGAYTGRYTAVVVPLVAVAAGIGALLLPGRRLAWMALAVLTMIGVTTGISSAATPRTSAAQIATVVRAATGPDAVLVSCPDQLAPPVARLLGPAYEQVVYPTLGAPERIDWVDYAQRQAAADPVEISRRLVARTGSRPLLVLVSPGYRTFGDQCGRLLRELVSLRGAGQLLYGEAGPSDQQLYLVPGR